MSAVSIDNVRSAPQRRSKLVRFLQRIAAALDVLARNRWQRRVPIQSLRRADQDIKRLHRIMHEHSPAFHAGRC